MARQKAACPPTVPSPTSPTPSRPRRPSQLNRALKQPTVSSRSRSSRRRPVRGLELQLHARMQCRPPGACRCAACLARRHQHHQQAVHPRRRCRILRWWRGCTHGTPRSLPLTKMRLAAHPLCCSISRCCSGDRRQLQERSAITRQAASGPSHRHGISRDSLAHHSQRHGRHATQDLAPTARHRAGCIGLRLRKFPNRQHASPDLPSPASRRGRVLVGCRRGGSHSTIH